MSQSAFRAAWGSPRYFLWTIGAILCFPLLLLAELTGRKKYKGGLFRRIWPRHVPKQIGEPSVIGPCIAMVFNGVGEMVMADHITQSIRAAFKNIRIVWAPVNHEIIERSRALGRREEIVTTPQDWAGGVQRWLELAQPDIVVFIERPLFYGLALCANRFGARVLLVNGEVRRLPRRLSPRRFGLISTLHSFHRLNMRTEERAAMLRPFLPSSASVDVTGSIKFGMTTFSLPTSQQQSLREWIMAGSHGALLIAGSTSPGDEEIVLQAFRDASSGQAATLLLAPRRTDRCDHVEKLCTSAGLSIARRTQGTPKGVVDVLLLDTWGELGEVYRFGVAAFIGNTFHGSGHNVLEPVSTGIPVAYGPQRGVFKEEQLAVEAAGLGFRVSGATELAEFWLKILNDRSFRTTCSRSAESFLADNAAPMSRTLDLIFQEIRRVEKSGRSVSGKMI